MASLHSEQACLKNTYMHLVRNPQNGYDVSLHVFLTLGFTVILCLYISCIDQDHLGRKITNNKLVFIQRWNQHYVYDMFLTSR